MAESYADPTANAAPARRMSAATSVGVILGDREPVPPAFAALQGEAEITVMRSSDADALAMRGERSEVLFVWEFRRDVLRDALPALSRLRWVQTASAGVDAVVSPELAAREIVVTNTRGVLDGAIAEWVLGVLLMFVKDLHGTISLQREHRWHHRESERLAGRRLLVVGAGSVGRAIARLARATGMRVEGISRNARSADEDFERVDATEALLDRLPQADFVVISAPLTAETRGMIDAKALAAMPRGCRLVNVGRGPIVDERALVDSIARGHLGGAALDVFAEEPLAHDSPLWDLDNVIVSPHQAGDFDGWRDAFTDVFIDNLRRWRRGVALHHVVDVAAAVGQGGNP